MANLSSQFQIELPPASVLVQTQPRRRAEFGGAILSIAVFAYGVVALWHAPFAKQVPPAAFWGELLVMGAVLLFWMWRLAVWIRNPGPVVTRCGDTLTLNNPHTLGPDRTIHRDEFAGVQIDTDREPTLVVDSAADAAPLKTVLPVRCVLL